MGTSEGGVAILVRLFLLFTVTTSLELYLLLQLGAAVGPTTTFLIILVTGMIGAWLARREGVAVIRNLQAEVARGLPPAGQVLEAALVLTGGLLLLTPGVLTDLTGFALLIPTSRKWIAPRCGAWLKQAMGVRSIDITKAGKVHVDLGGPGRPVEPEPSTNESPFEHPVPK